MSPAKMNNPADVHYFPEGAQQNDNCDYSTPKPACHARKPQYCLVELRVTPFLGHRGTVLTCKNLCPNHRSSAGIKVLRGTVGTVRESSTSSTHACAFALVRVRVVHMRAQYTGRCVSFGPRSRL